MKYVKYLMALAALCILAMPAFSMPDDRYTAADGNNQAIDDQAPPLGITGEDDHQPCDLQMPVGHDGKKLPCHKHIRSMMGEKGPEGVQGSEPHMAEMEQDGKQGLKPMMGDCPCPCPCNKEIPEHIKSMMGERRPEGMQGEQPNMAEMGPDGKKGPEPGEPAMGDNTCGKEGPKPVMSMMGDKNCGPDGHKHIKSMMGDKEHGPAGARTIVVNLNL